MSARDIAIVGFVAGIGYLALKLIGEGNMPDMIDKPKTLLPGHGEYLDKLSEVESSNRPYVKASTSSASGLFQFTRATWESLGGTWGPDMSKPFGGLRPTTAEQVMRAGMLTARNIALLARAAIDPTDAAKYAIHFLGPVAIRVWNAADTAMVAPIVGAAVVKANPFLLHMTVADFKAWAGRKIG